MLSRQVMVEYIKAEISRQEITDAEFARRAGVTQKHLSRVMMGHVLPSMEMLDYWAFILGWHWYIELRDLDG